ncbi:hypothetical protein, partial [Muricoccus vinaceus]
RLSRGHLKPKCNFHHVDGRYHSDLSKDAVERFHERDLTRLEGVSLDESDDVLIRVARLREAPPPPADAMFDGWIQGLGAVTEPPRLLSKRMVTVSLDEASDLEEAGLTLQGDVMEQRGPKADPLKVDVVLRLENMPEFSKAFEEWRDGPWATWAEAERPRRRSIDVYNRLFTAHQRMVAAGRARNSLRTLKWNPGSVSSSP